MSQLQKALEMVEHFYLNQRAKRSGVLLMAHIYEGVNLLKHTPENVQAAFAVHPLLQDLENLTKNIRWCVEELDSEVVSLALEYREAANAYLCRPTTDSWGEPALFNQLKWTREEVLWMLYADKVQNQKDFLLYHSKTHQRRTELAHYFETWISALTQVLELNHYLPCAIIVVRQKDSILLTKRTEDISFPGQWCLPGGMQEDGEDLLTCAIRELYEEVGIKLGDEEVVKPFTVPEYFLDGKYHVHIYEVSLNPFTDTYKHFQPSSEVSEASFFTSRDLPGLTGLTSKLVPIALGGCKSHIQT